MLGLDFFNRLYTVEVLQIRRQGESPFEAISRLTVAPRSVDSFEETAILHAFVPSEERLHRAERKREVEDGEFIEVPRRHRRRGHNLFLYDVLAAQRNDLVAIAVPFHGLAREFFPKVDRALSGTNTVYERLDINRLLIQMGVQGALPVSLEAGPESFEVSLTRCHLAYADPEKRSRDISHVSMAGANLGETDVYRNIIRPVFKPTHSAQVVTPVLLGFTVSCEGVKKASAMTDRHGNFKVYISPGVRQLLRLFLLLDVVSSVQGVVSTTSSLPILQSRDLEDTEV